MDMKVQGLRSGKALGIGELLAIALVALVLDKIDHNTKAQRLEQAVLNV